MPQYRIFEHPLEHASDDGKTCRFVPQIRRWWWPFWTPLHMCSYTGHDWSPRGWPTKAEAIAAVNAHRNPPPEKQPMIHMVDDTRSFFLFMFGLAALGCAVGVVQACAPKTTITVAGDRSVVQVAAGKFTADGDGRPFYILRDPDTGVDYLAVIDAGIIKLEPKPPAKVER